MCGNVLISVAHGGGYGRVALGAVARGQFCCLQETRGQVTGRHRIRLFLYHMYTRIFAALF